MPGGTPKPAGLGLRGGKFGGRLSWVWGMGPGKGRGGPEEKGLLVRGGLGIPGGGAM
jgi:hypothetical protein